MREKEGRKRRESGRRMWVCIDCCSPLDRIRELSDPDVTNRVTGKMQLAQSLQTIARAALHCGHKACHTLSADLVVVQMEQIELVEDALDAEGRRE